MNWQMALGVSLEALGAISLVASGPPNVPSVLLYVAFGSLALAVFGSIRVIAGDRVAGAKLVLFGSLFFIPLGLLAIFGARRVLDEERGGRVLQSSALLSLATQERYFSRHANLQLWSGIFICSMGLLTLVLTGKMSVAFFGILFVVLGLAARRNPVIALGESHLEIRAAVLREKTVVRYTDILSTDEHGKNIVLTTTEGRVVVPLVLIAEPERALVRRQLDRYALRSAA